jgi:hypothetical protein
MTNAPTRKRKTAAAPANTIAPKASPRPDTKKARLIARLQDPLGLDVTTLSTELGWQPHSTRAALTSLRKDGYKIERLPSESDQPTRYRIAGSAACCSISISSINACAE